MRPVVEEMALEDFIEVVEVDGIVIDDGEAVVEVARNEFYHCPLA